MSSQTAKDTKNSLLANVFDFLEIAVYALVLVAVLFAFFIRIVGVEGGSMNDTLANGDRLVLTKAFYTPQRGDIVVVSRDDAAPLIKRIIAVAGDTIEIDYERNAVLLNGEVLDEPYVHYYNKPYDMIDNNGPVTVPEGHVFVMGDHRDNSLDSRTDSIGFVDEDNIIGKAVWRFLPFESFGGLYDNM